MSPIGKGPLRIAIEDFLDTFGFGKRIEKWTVAFIEMLENEGYEVYGNFVGQFGLAKYLPDMLQPNVIKSRSKVAPVQLAPIILMIFGIVLGVFAGAMQPIARIIMYQVDRIAQSFRPDPVLLYQVLRRNKTLAPKIKEYLSDLGVHPDIQEMLDIATQQLQSPMELIALLRRGWIDPGIYTQRMEELGFSQRAATDLQLITDVIPGVADLVLMATREAWNDDIANRFKYDEEFPKEFADNALKQGLSIDWSKRYWRSHWQLPGPGQVFEMYQRLRDGQSDNPVTLEDLNTYLKTADYPEFWRTRLTEIAYNPLTRVDVRRMYAVGVLTADEVYQEYLNQGYNQRDAKRLADFTTKIEKSEEKGLTRAALQDAYRRGVWTRDQTLTALQSIGFTPEDADFWLDLIDVELQNREIDDKLAVIQEKYIANLLDDTTVYNELGPLNLPTERQNNILALWNVRKYNRVALPSRSELDDFLRRAIIDDTEYQSRLKRDGYEPAVIDWYVRRIDSIIADDSRIAAEQTQAEQERISKAERATDYQKGVADLNVELADIDVTIADIKVALHDVTNPEDVDALRQQITLLQFNKKEKQLQKAMLRQDLIAGQS